MVSYVLAGFTCLLAALCYAEFAAMTPVAGSAYTYAYTTLGELFAWIIGWDLILEYAVGASTVATGWSAYFSNFLTLLPPDWGLTVPHDLNDAPLEYDEAGEFAATDVVSSTCRPSSSSSLLTAVLVKGIKESAGRQRGDGGHQGRGGAVRHPGRGMTSSTRPTGSNFAPYGWTGINFFGYQVAGQINGREQPLGMIAGAAIIFFAYIGFDAVSTQAEEAKNPQRDMPIGIIGSLVICTVLYIAVVVVLTGMVPYDQLDKKAGGVRGVRPGRACGGPKALIAAAGRGRAHVGAAGHAARVGPRADGRCPATGCCRRSSRPSTRRSGPRGRGRSWSACSSPLMAGVPAARRPAGDDQHRDAVRVRGGLRGGAGDAVHQPDGPAAVPGARSSRSSAWSGCSPACC